MKDELKEMEKRRLGNKEEKRNEKRERTVEHKISKVCGKVQYMLNMREEHENNIKKEMRLIQ